MPSPKLANGPVKHDSTPNEMVPEEAPAVASVPTATPLPSTVAKAIALVNFRIVIKFLILLIF
jgi:hypothetical protein